MNVPNPFRSLPALLIAAMLLVPRAGSADDVRSTLDRWMETRKLISDEENRWREERSELEQTIELLERELRRLEDEIDNVGAEGSEAESEAERLREENANLIGLADALEHRTGRIENALPSLFAVFPEPLRERTRTLVSRDFREGADENPSPDAPLAQRIQAVIGFLGEADRFQQSVQVGREIIPLDGRETEVRVLYLGLGQAYYLGPGSDRAGAGRPGANGWEWTPLDDQAASIRRVFAVYDREAAPGFIRLPVSIRPH